LPIVCNTDYLLVWQLSDCDAIVAGSQTKLYATVLHSKFEFMQGCLTL